MTLMTIDKIRTVLVTDCGSTTTKALFFEKTSQGWRQTFRGEAPTTVEEPVADVTVGAINAFTEVEEIAERQILRAGGSANDETPPFVYTTEDPSAGIDLYLSTSSAGGGLQMMVAGIVKEMTTESAERAALGAGAIIMDAISADDGREDHQKISQVRHIKPDIVLLTGGVDGGSKTHVLEVAEMLLAASPKPRFGETLLLPVIYAGNKEAAEEVKNLLAKKCQVSVVDNVRPTLETENLKPAREAIHEFFLTHVMSHSPGYKKLLSWTPQPIMPTPAAVGLMIESYARSAGKTVLCADIGGATTDVFSVFNNNEGRPIFNRTVSANFGMSYSIANVLIEAGPDNISRWLPYELKESELRDRLRNKMIRPTSIPQTLEDLWLEQAVCREALRLSLGHHRSLAVGLSGMQQKRGIADVFSQKASRYELVNMMDLDVVIGSGGVLSHAPERLSAALMMIDGFGLEGVTQLTVDSVFMLPHLGVFSSYLPTAAAEIFEKDCLINIGHSVAPVYSSVLRDDTLLVEVIIDGEKKCEIRAGSVELYALPQGKEVEMTLKIKDKSVDLGAGQGSGLSMKIQPGLAGLVLDGRNRPIKLPLEPKSRIEQQQKIYRKLGLMK